MATMKHVGTFHLIDTVLDKVTELNSKGYTEKQIYGVSGKDDLIAILQRETEIALHGGNGEDSVLGVFSRMGFSEEKAKVYFQEVKDGGIALFVEDVQLDTNGALIEMDSAVELGLSGEQLEGQDQQQLTIGNEGTVPRINTRNL